VGDTGSVGVMISRRDTVDIAVPFNPRLKTRLERAIAQAVHSPTRAMPTLRRAVLVATAELRAQGYQDERISALLGQLVEDVVRARALDTRSIVSGQPRWSEVRSKVMQWTLDAPRA